ncbi:Cu(I)-responsive transcriptional regulator [Thaumasiovibrio subtropicus]|uniref:Cu(I)-responsive transcriptional regulator n=1 Tax=Thaumasiovibrio subtropicus TaxID=1891207 RepID=UPI000B35724B|nr:Cu(I)-responsive transcriptional regulator [Thaumasiovibrio subtropicus]
MNISEVAKRTGLTTKTIRFYEQKALITAPERAENGYRAYHESHVAELSLIKRAKLVGFSLDECRALLSLSRDPQRSSADVKQHALDKLSEIDERIHELEAMRTTLQALTQQCPGDGSPQCPILSALSDNEVVLSGKPCGH